MHQQQHQRKYNRYTSQHNSKRKKNLRTRARALFLSLSLSNRALAHSHAIAKEQQRATICRFNGKTTGIIAVWCIIQNRGQAYDASFFHPIILACVQLLMAITQLRRQRRRRRRRRYRMVQYAKKPRATAIFGISIIHSSRILIILSLTNSVTIFPSYCSSSCSFFGFSLTAIC